MVIVCYLCVYKYISIYILTRSRIIVKVTLSVWNLSKAKKWTLQMLYGLHTSIVHNFLIGSCSKVKWGSFGFLPPTRLFVKLNQNIWNKWDGNAVRGATICWDVGGESALKGGWLDFLEQLIAQIFWRSKKPWNIVIESNLGQVSCCKTDTQFAHVRTCFVWATCKGFIALFSPCFGTRSDFHCLTRTWSGRRITEQRRFKHGLLQSCPPACPSFGHGAHHWGQPPGQYEHRCWEFQTLGLDLDRCAIVVLKAFNVWDWNGASVQVKHCSRNPQNLFNSKS